MARAPLGSSVAACVARHAAGRPGKAALVERMQSRHAIRTVEAAAQHGVGVRDYQLITLA